MRQIVLDTETTGLRTEDGHKIIEIGCVEMVNRKLTGKRLHHYLNPQRDIEEDALKIHGITKQFLQDKPLFSDIAQELIDFISDSELIIHNAPFDVGFLNYELNLANKKFKSVERYCRIFDSLVLARQLHVGQRNSLDALCKRYGIDNSQRELHGALLDAHLLAQVYLTMTGGQGSLFDELQVSDLEVQSNATISNTVLIKRQLRVIKASPEELAAHNERLETISKQAKSGQLNAW